VNQETKLITLGEDNFQQEVLESRVPVLVDFWAEWCGPCRSVAPVIEQLASEFSGRAKVGKLDVDAHPDLVSRYGIRGVPALLFFRDGEVADQVIGLTPKQQLEDRLEALVGGGAPAQV